MSASRISGLILVCLTVACSGRSYLPLPDTTLDLQFVPAQAIPAPRSVAAAEVETIDDLLTVAVNVIQPGEAVFGAAFDVVYDPDEAEFVSWQPGSALEVDGGTVTYLVQSGAGRLELGASLQGGQGADVPGTQPMIFLTFRVFREGVSGLEFENASLLDDGPPLPQPIPGLSWFGGTIMAE